MTNQAAGPQATGPSLRTVVGASAAGTAFEWYDFFIFGSLAGVIAQHFYAEVGAATGYILALITFGVGFVVRPLGALVFGWFGDRTGRKTTFLVTITLMGLATVAIGFLPTFEQAGVIAPILLITMRVLQGFALGGEYGGAAIYVAEHAPARQRGYLTGWIQTTAALGLIGALGVILITRMAVGQEAFAEWGWRIPFLVSALLLAISLWIRLKLNESPAYQRMEAESHAPRAPYREAFGTWKNLKVVLLALVGIMFAQGAVWYCGYFYSRFFMERFLKMEVATVDMLILGITVVSAFLYVFFGWLSDKVGRKPVMLGGMLLMLVAVFPGFHLMTQAGNPALAQAQAQSPVTVVADPATCSVQFDPVGRAAFSTSCDIAKSVLTNAGVSYANAAAPAGSVAEVRIGDVVVASVEGAGLSAEALTAARAEVQTAISAALTAHGYPTQADPTQIDMARVFAVLLVFIVAATALYGPQAAALVELFPTRIRYTAMSLPYNIGTGWVGGLLPAASFALVAWKGDIYFGLWYTVAFTLIALVTAIFFLPETRGRDLDSIET
ncbi:MAG TPA: MFS transporter [Brevundimonas sp.]|jgi:MFS family permease|uniref:MFS transporter n=1 Tax=Brevundimonas sp. TaxID=1871086 RepID=UPI002C410CF2|nr:MFS transporter [Brevundimonas sp.]HRH20876.1 MFS transporter [Brevundimonas sp.]